MMSARLQPMELAIERVRNDGQRMPVVGNAVGERPDNSVRRETLCYFCVIDDVRIVVVINKFVSERLAENNPGDRGQKNANADNERARRFSFLAWRIRERHEYSLGRARVAETPCDKDRHLAAIHSLK